MHDPSLATGRPGRTMEDRGAVRTRPTNNQLLYKAYFRWQHYPVPSSPIYDVNETDACASVTAAFLQAMRVLQEVEAMHCPTQRNVLKILSQDTRHTKVVNLACGTHRVSDELKKHYLTDIEGTQYTTNLDRNRYGADNQYMFTVIRHNLSSLGLCPCLVDVEVLDQKSNETVMVSAGIEACICEEPWREIKDDKVLCEGRSCSPGSSANSEAKSSGKSTSFAHGTAPTSSVKGSCSRSPLLEAESFRTTVDNRCGRGTTHYEFNTAVGLASTNRHQPQGSARRARKAYNKSASSIDAENLFDSKERGKQRFSFSAGQGVSEGFGKRTRENESGEGIFWELQSSMATQGSAEASKTSLGVDYKRMKSSFSQLSFDSERIMDEVAKMKSKMTGLDPMRYQIEEDGARIRRMEDELISLKAEMRRYASESRQVESQLLANRRVIGMLLNCLRQSLGAQPGIGNDVCLPNPSSPLTSDRDAYIPSDAMQTMMSQQNGFQGDSGAMVAAGTGPLSNQAVPTMPMPEAMMIALANHATHGMDGHSAYDAKWGFTHSSSANSGLPGNVNGTQQDLAHRSLQEDPAVREKRLSSLMNSKMAPQGTPCGFRDDHDVYEFTYGSV